MENKTYPQAIRSVARQWPDALALCYKGETARTLTYRELDDYSTRAAAFLAAAGCRPGMIIPLLLNRGLDCVVWALGIIKAGAAAVPLAENTPRQRVRFIFEDTGTPFILAHPDLMEQFPGLPAKMIKPEAWQKIGEHNNYSYADGKPDDPILVYFTSGTTGRPKGVSITHANVLGFARRHTALHHIGPETRVAAYATVSFDAFVMDVYAPLTTGARVYLLGEADRMSLVALHRYFMRNRIEFSFLTTRLGEAYMRSFDNPHLKRLATGGETLRTFVSRQYKVFNLYGPTETTAYVTAARITESAADYPLGRALEGMRVMVLDGNDSLCPLGQIGEICIAGDQVAREYQGRPEETAKAFTANPQFNPATDAPEYRRIYRTGDSGETGEDGQLYFRGRMDHQVKIRGFRIEPGEVEAALMTHPDVRHAHVRPFYPNGGDTCLAAYVSRSLKSTDTDVFLHSVKVHLKATLPVQMVPGYFGEVDDFPLNANGKVDVAALPEPVTLQQLSPPLS